MRIRILITKLLWPMVFLLPLWVAAGRAFLNNSGLLTILYALFVSPLLFIGLLIITLLLRTSSKFKVEKLLSKSQANVLLALYTCIFLHGFFIIGVSDTKEQALALATLYLSIIFLVIAFIMALVARIPQFNPRHGVTIGCILLLLFIGITHTINRPHQQDSPQAKDKQISYDFQLMHQDIEAIYYENDVLPTMSALEIAKIGHYSKQETTAERADAYTYIPESDGHFKLCAKFLTSTLMGSSDGQPLSTNENSHYAGYQCIAYNAQD